MRQFSQGLIEDWKQMYEEEGETITDYEANEAMNRLCDFFSLLNQWDQEDKAREKTGQETSASENS